MGGKRAVRAVADLGDETIPAWQRQSMRRSLQSARARAYARSDRFVTAATRLLQEKGNADFTVQEVIDGSGMSIRTFYKYFGSKEDLLVAVYETVIAREAVPRLRAPIEKNRDALLQLRTYIESLIEVAAHGGPAHRTLVSFQNRLAERRPADLARAMKPQVNLLVELIKNISRTRPLRDNLTVEAAAQLVHYTVTAAAHARTLGTEGSSDITAQTVWQFCSSGMGLVGTDHLIETRDSDPSRRRSSVR
jgi:AcrR family transcriptional regulator